jgi:hypothetical protein
MTRSIIIAAALFTLAGSPCVSRAEEPSGETPTAPATTPSEAPQTPAAREALDRYNRAAAQAEKDYRAAITKARHELLEALEVAKKIVMKNGSLDEANRIESVIKANRTDAPIKVNPDERKAPTLSERIATQRYFMYWWGTHEKLIGKEPRVLELLPNGRIGQGADSSERTWKATGQGLVISGEVGAVDLVECVDGTFRGSSRHSGAAVTLAPKSR